MKILKKIFGYCENCGRWFIYPKRRRMSTAYVDEESNYCTECKDCFEETEACWKEMWDDYNSGRF